MKIFIVALSVFPLMINCNNANKNTEPTTQIPDEHTSQIALDWKGVYTGVLPCTDCEGIRTKIILRDSTYNLSSMYLGKEEVTENVSYGSFSWTSDGSTVVLHDEPKPNSYKVEENRLVKLDMEDHIISGELSEMYQLNKLSHPILDQKWVLIELNGSVPDYGNAKVIDLRLNSEDSRAIGFSGCNNYTGEFDLDETILRFSKMAATLMACDKMDLESEYNRMLNAVTGFTLERETLVLHSAEKQAVARFKKGEV